MAPDAVPDKTLVEHGFHFETLDEYVRRAVVTALGL